MSLPASSQGGASPDDKRFMAAAVRLARRHMGLTGTNPSVGALIVSDKGHGAQIVGRGVTATGGRPHAETQAIGEAGELARGATAYVTLEPCAHHGMTPPCAEALIAAGVARVVVGVVDPDPRVSGRGLALLRRAGIEVVEGVLAGAAGDDLSGYLIRSVKERPEVILKLAISSDGLLGRRGAGQVAITGAVSRAQVHLMRAQSDAVLVGIGTAIADDPLLTCRLTGLEARSPIRIVIDPELRLPVTSWLVRTARDVPLWLVAGKDADARRRMALEDTGCRCLSGAFDGGQLEIGGLLRQLAAEGVGRLLVEGGAATALHFLEAGLVDRLALFRGADEIGGPDGVAAPDLADYLPAFHKVAQARYGEDGYTEYRRMDREGGACSQAS